MARGKPYKQLPGQDIHGNPVNPGDLVAIATKGMGSAYLYRGRYLGLRETGYSYRPHSYVVEQDRVRKVRMNAAGVVWKFQSWRQGHDEQKAELEAAIGVCALHNPHNPYRWGTPEYNNWHNTQYIPYQKAQQEYNAKKEAWLDANYPWTKIPFTRRSTLQLNKILKL